ncbi:DUF2339 domain-containing protein [Massilia sp. erpn]|uniref:DUF2339 domain-containing protein n=1 Tax=Massilia sp. erpn TaxID=2738142 RepID=UPI0021075853|nr:DUF2339 domain-containing protein [Massilia sp. erpn]UTY56676.1 DUF2339 domain-containing protein [Massilia sp. erpn]
MDLLWLIVSIILFRMVWTARKDARAAATLARDLKKDVRALEEQIAVLQKTAQPPQSAPSPASLVLPAMAPTPLAAVTESMPVQDEVEAWERQVRVDSASAATPSTTPAVRTDSAAAAHHSGAAAPVATPLSDEEAFTAADDAAEAAAYDEARAPQQPARPATPPPPPQPPQWLVAAKAWLFGGNLVAKVGLLILFIGVSFLLKYTAARVTVPIEFRLAGIVLADIALLAWAWRIREKRPAISLPAQGTALAMLMLVTFGAFRIYHLIPGGLAFAVLFVLTAFTCLLAVLQNAQWLAIFGIVGGFAAPILASTGGGSHIGLFSYYALLNAGVLAIALLRSWRALNLLGFAFTFAIGTAWGVLRYEPENYLSAQLFLLLFFLYYVGIAIAYAHKQAPRLKHYVDGTLVFGTPMLAASLQFSLVKGMEFGMALSAMALGLFYAVLALALARRRERYGLLVDALLALAIVFGTLAIPFALDGRWTSAAWALEGTGIVWVGLRQRQPLAWGFGLLVQAGAWVSFLGAISGIDTQAALHSNLWLGFLLLAAAAFMMALQFRAQQGEQTPPAFRLLAALFLGGAALWLTGGAWTEIFLRTSGSTMSNLLMASALFTAAALGWIARRMAWSLAGSFALAVQGLAGLTLLMLLASQWPGFPVPSNLFDTPALGGMLLLAGALFSSWSLMRHGGKELAGLSPLCLAWSGLWWLLMVAPILAGWLTTHYALLNNSNPVMSELPWPAYCLLIAISTPAAMRMAHRLAWPDLRWAAAPAWALLFAVTLHMLTLMYAEDRLPAGAPWVAYAALLLMNEWLMRVWQRCGWDLPAPALKALHTVRSAGPWLMIWPVASHWIARWLQGGSMAETERLAQAGWTVNGSWAHFLPAWLMMGVLAWTMRRSRSGGWPVAPLPDWYRYCLIPLGCIWSVLLLAVWNLTQNGAMAPLPYLPLLNPLDLSSAFAMLLAVSCYRLLHERLQPWRDKLLAAGACAAYAWFNLALLRTVANYRDLPYLFDVLFASQFVQAMLSLVWSITALLLMRYAVQHSARKLWLAGAALLGVVVAKLFLVDLSNVGGVERIVSFLGVGALMVGIGYLAPYPSARGNKAETETV